MAAHGHSFFMMLVTFVLRRYNNELQTSEVFSTAGRTVKSGLVASAVVSSWTWAATRMYHTMQPNLGLTDDTSLAILICRLQIRCLWTVLVRFWCNCTGHPVRDSGHRAQAPSTKRTHLSRSHQSSLWWYHSWCLHQLWSDDQYPGHSHAAHRW